MQLLGGQSTLVVIGAVCQSHSVPTVQLMGNAADAVAVVIHIGIHFGQGRLSVCGMGMRYGSGPVGKRIGGDRGVVTAQQVVSGEENGGLR